MVVSVCGGARLVGAWGGWLDVRVVWFCGLDLVASGFGCWGRDGVVFRCQQGRICGCVLKEIAAEISRWIERILEYARRVTTLWGTISRVTYETVMPSPTEQRADSSPPRIRRSDFGAGFWPLTSDDLDAAATLQHSKKSPLQLCSKHVAILAPRAC